MARFFTLSALRVVESVRPPALDTCAVGSDHERHSVSILLTPNSVTCMHVKIMHVGRFMHVGSPCTLSQRTSLLTSDMFHLFVEEFTAHVMT